MSKLSKSASTKKNKSRYSPLRIGCGMLLLGAIGALLFDAHIGSMAAAQRGGDAGLGYVGSLIVLEIFFGPIALLWFFVELVVWALRLRLITNGLGVASPFLVLIWIYLASPARGIGCLGYYALVLVAALSFFGAIVYLRKNKKYSKRITAHNVH